MLLIYVGVTCFCAGGLWMLAVVVMLDHYGITTTNPDIGPVEVMTPKDRENVEELIRLLRDDRIPQMVGELDVIRGLVNSHDEWVETLKVDADTLSEVVFEHEGRLRELDEAVWQPEGSTEPTIEDRVTALETDAEAKKTWKDVTEPLLNVSVGCASPGWTNEVNMEGRMVVHDTKYGFHSVDETKQ